jgi:predicted O-methyltransferase YrrM
VALQVEVELAQMVALYRERKPRRVLEIGVWEGGTLQQWLQHAPPKATVVAVDLAHPRLSDYRAWRQQDTTLVVLFGSSQAAETMAAIAQQAPYDWVFVDGDHALEAVFSDVNLGLTHLRDGGVLLMHDIVPPTGEESYPPGAVLEWLSGTRRLETIVSDEPSEVSHGIGVVYA